MVFTFSFLQANSATMRGFLLLALFALTVALVVGRYYHTWKFPTLTLMPTRMAM